MSLRRWMREQLTGDAQGDVPPGGSILESFLGKAEERTHSLGEYTAATYPDELKQLLQHRQRVSEELLKIDVASPESRIAAIEPLRELLRIYPHPLVYEILIHAYVDAGRTDEAKGVAFAARERRTECSRSPYPEVRAEIEHLREWSSDDVEDLSAERKQRATASGPP